MKIAISSDNHLDVNQVNIEQALTFQSNWLKKNKVDYYLFGGDLFNNFTKTERYFNELQKLTPDTKIFYILGNHDMLNNISFDEIEHPRSPLYIHNRSIDIPNTNWRIIGNNGWYDYSFSQYAKQPTKVQTWKKVYWLDSSIDQPIDDQERMKNVLDQVKAQLSSGKAAGKRVIFLTHFAPRHELLAPKPAAVNTPRKERFYQMINAMMGSDQLGNLLEDSSIVKYAFYGHLHGIHPPLKQNNTIYYSQAVGVNNKRINEWQRDNFFDQWVATIRSIDVR
ncbi:MAG: metallophosphoesterase [Candidatus Limosilactobacillus merdavium]|uniref:Metallophosphoesterase n=1 Tax=Candidatus Limosilactobacillus merdavium TaxID=2838651 RepID=A0A9E2KTL2_9LACO|nr:metallophosphoesterase [Candidatus Limosilactobacillus merdavium]